MRSASYLYMYHKALALYMYHKLNTYTNTDNFVCEMIQHVYRGNNASLAPFQSTCGMHGASSSFAITACRAGKIYFEASIQHHMQVSVRLVVHV